MPALCRRLAGCSCLLAAILALGGCGGSGSSGHHPVRVHRLPLSSIFEAGPQLRSDPGGTLDTLRSLGVDTVKVFLPWTELAPASSAPTPPTGFNAADPAAYAPAAWSTFDAIVRAAADRGIAVDLAVNSPPLWAAGRGAPGPHPQWRTSPRAYGQFLRAVATRYDGHYRPSGAGAPLPRVGIWSIWNEPNYGPDLAPQASENSSLEVSPALYRNLLDAAWRALHATGHGADTVLIGETAPRGQTGGNHPGSFDGMVPLRFVRALYCVDSSLRELQGSAAIQRQCPTGTNARRDFRHAHPALFEATGFADHPYGQGSIPPNQLTPGEPDYADFPAIPRLEHVLDHVQQLYGSDRRLPIYSTEFGYQTNPPERIVNSASPARAALYLNWAEYLSWRDPRILSYDQYQLIDPPTANAVGGFATGLEFANGAHKATFGAYRLPIFLPVTSAGRSTSLEVWGRARPAYFASAPQPVSIEFRSVSGGGFRVVRRVRLAGRYGVFDVQQRFPGSGTVRLSWRYPDGRRILSRDVVITLR